MNTEELDLRIKREFNKRWSEFANASTSEAPISMSASSAPVMLDEPEPAPQPTDPQAALEYWKRRQSHLIKKLEEIEPRIRECLRLCAFGQLQMLKDDRRRWLDELSDVNDQVIDFEENQHVNNNG